MIRINAVPILALLAIGASQGFAQDAPRHPGRIGVGFGLGGGWAGFSCNSCIPALAQGPSTGRRLGLWGPSLDVTYAPTEHLECGIQLRESLHGLTGDSVPDLATFAVQGTVFPYRFNGPFLQAGVGFSRFAIVNGSGDVFEPVEELIVAGWGSAYTISVGWEFGLVRARIGYARGMQRLLHDRDGAVVARDWRYNQLFLEASLHPYIGGPCYRDGGCIF